MAGYPEAYIDFLAHFHATRDYFECHELLEEYWKQESDLERKQLWHGLIQVAVALYHQRRGNWKGARQMLSSGAERLSQTNLQPSGLDPASLLHLLRQRLLELDEITGSPDQPAKPYTDLNLPFEDQELLKQAAQTAEAWKAEWGRPSPMGDVELIHRHTRRDRSDVIREREERLKERERDRG